MQAIATVVIVIIVAIAGVAYYLATPESPGTTVTTGTRADETTTWVAAAMATAVVLLAVISVTLRRKRYSTSRPRDRDYLSSYSTRRDGGEQTEDERKPAAKTPIRFRKHIFAGILISAITLILEIYFIKQLSVYNAKLSGWFLAEQFALPAIGFVLYAVLGSLATSGFIEKLEEDDYSEKKRPRKWPWMIYYALLFLFAFASFTWGLGDGLQYDVVFATIASKSGFDLLNIRYLNGYSILFTFALILLFMLSDPRFSVAKGMDGKRHIFVHSKAIGLMRFFTTDEGKRIGSNPDFPMIVETEDTKPTAGKTGSSLPFQPEERVTRTIKNAHWNDRVRLFSWPMGGWIALKLLIGWIVASWLAPGFAEDYLLITSYMKQIGISWLSVIQQYASILVSRLSGQVLVDPKFAITNAFVFETFQYLHSFYVLFMIVAVIRLTLGIVGEAAGMGHINSYGGSNPPTSSVSRIGASLFAMFFLVGASAVMKIGTWLFDATTYYTALNAVLLLAVIGILSLWFKTSEYEDSLLKPFRVLARSLFSGDAKRVSIAIFLLAVLVVGCFLPSAVSLLTVKQQMEERYQAYTWEPAVVPSIQYTRWAYELDQVKKIDLDAIKTQALGVQDHVRIFTDENARFNMRPHLGQVNWMSIDKSEMDIVLVGKDEYWVTLATLVRPEYPNDEDKWRGEHLILTHSEKVFAVDALTTQRVDIEKLWNLTETPQLYYGEGGLWSDVNEIYLNIPTFSEQHLPDYQGPQAYNDKVDYTYKDFWRWWEFGWMGRWVFAGGEYGNIKALVLRDVNERVSKILLPGMELDKDAYPVADDQGNIYLMHWVWIKRQSPSEFADYKEHQDTQIMRRFAVVLTNLKNGEMTGYLMNKERSDYILSFFRSFYKQWDNPLPQWLTRQMRYPENFLEKQIDIYNWYFQDDRQGWQNNVFLELTMQEVKDKDGNVKKEVIEDTRYIMQPLLGKLTWSGVRLTELYESSGSRNVAGIYIAPSGEDTGQLYFIFLGTEKRAILGPATALSALRAEPATKQALFMHPDWNPGNILLYSIEGNIYYIIPFYAETEVGAQKVVLPVMVGVVDASSLEAKRAASYMIKNTNDPNEVKMAPTYALARIGITVQTQETNKITGTIEKDPLTFMMNGDQFWVLTIKTDDGKVFDVYAKASTFGTDRMNELVKIARAKIGDTITFEMDQSNFITKVY